MEISPDPYEQKLYHMFKSHDTECLGTLDETALIKLCSSLELNDKGNVLISSLVRGNKTRVSFKAFKEALLNFLGTEMEGKEPEKSLVISENVLLHGAPDSPGREISPKLVMGSKKYGRRSRPQSLVTDSSPSDSDTENSVIANVNHTMPQKVQRSSSQSEISGARRRRPNSGSKLKRCASLPAQRGNKAKEQLSKQQAPPTQAQLASSVESLGNLDFENLSHTLYEIWSNFGNELGTHYLNRDQLEIVCERVGLQKVAEKVAEEVFEKLKLCPNDTISFKDFIGLIQSDAESAAGSANEQKFVSEDSTPLVGNSLCNLVDPSNDNELHAKDIPTQFETVPMRSVVEMWENVNIPDAKRLLLNLGFDDEEINISHLSKTLEEELRGIHGEPQIALLKAALALRKAEIASLQQSFRQLMEENRKLHADNKEAIRRAAMLAQEIDERHANLEDSTKSEIRMLEQRHAEVIRELTSQLANDRENWSAINVRLESRIKTLEQDEVKSKGEIQSLQDENSALEKEQILLQKQITELLESNIKLNNDIIQLEDRQRNDDGDKGEKETEEVLELIEKITSLQVENADLRDKNDELVAEVEGLGMELSRLKTKKVQGSRPSTDSGTEQLSDDPEQTSLGVKRRGDSPSKTRITEESPRLGKLRKCSNDNSESEASGDWMALNSELNSNPNAPTTATPTNTTSGFSQDFSSISDIKDEEIKNLKEQISKLEKELALLKEKCTKDNSNGSSNTEEENYELRCKELEISLEQMRKAYEECEDYWQCKLNEERQLFEKERQIYEDEQKESDNKFAELMEKVREYEEQFSKDGRLSPIEEKDVLEQQYIDLETELEELKENAKNILEEKTKEIAKLQEMIQDLKSRLGENIEAHSHAVAENAELESSASSPISYLWNQSTIQVPARDYQNPNWNNKPKPDTRLDNLSTSKTSIFSTPIENSSDDRHGKDRPSISPIQKPTSSIKSQMDEKDDETASNVSGKSFESQSIASSHGARKSSAIASNCSSPNEMKEELKRLKFVEMQLREHIQNLALKRDGLVMELQQLQEAKPVLEKAYAYRAAHPTLLQRVNQLEQKNRHLQTALRQQQQYTESIMHQTWQQQSSEIADLHNRLENQGMIITEQTQRLTNADLLIKELYVENSHLTATIQRLEQQRSRDNMLHHQRLSGLSGMP